MILALAISINKSQEITLSRALLGFPAETIVQDKVTLHFRVCDLYNI
jgi:hypothetical protein